MSDKGWRSLGIVAALSLVGGAWGPMISAGTHRWPFALQFRLGFVAAGLIAAACFVWRHELLGAAIGVGTGAVAAMMMGHTWPTLRGADLGNFAQPGWGFTLLVSAGATFDGIPMKHAAIVPLLVTFASLAGRSADAQGAPLAITNVTVIDGSGGPARPHMTVEIRGGRIAATDAGAGLRIPPDAKVIDGTGKFLIPGLWDMHVHLAKAGENALGLFIANGVTSVRDMGGDFALVARWRSETADGARVGPRIRTAGPMLESAGRVHRMKARGTIEPVDRFRAPVTDTVDARRVVDSAATLGVDFVKVRTAPSAAVYRAVAAEAGQRGLTLAAHGDIVAPEVMLDAGQRSIEHAIYPPLQKRDAATRARLIRRMADARVAIVPTMVNYYNWLLVPPSDTRRIVDDSLGRVDPRRRYVSGYLIDDWREQVAERRGLKDALIRRFYLPRAYRSVLADLQEMHRAGVPILPGTDVAVALMYPGFSLHDELEYFVEKIGMTPLDALRSATRDAAEFSGMLDSLGTVSVGKLADLVLLDADPLADIRNLARVHSVIVGGRLLDRERLLRDAARSRAGRQQSQTCITHGLANEAMQLTSEPRKLAWRATCCARSQLASGVRPNTEIGGIR